ncbi:MAG: hypothetical protein NC218_01455 [Acetobacter sp.]|nr:hypothetical protein [Acetobacter sp.]
MKDFTKLPPRPPAPLPTPEKTDKYIFSKKAWAKSITRSPAVQQAVEDWLLSFKGGMAKKDFESQLCKLHADDEKAIKQLSDSNGKRIIRQAPRDKPPKLQTDVITALATYKSVAIEANSGKKAIEAFLDSLQNTTGVYILDVNELILEYTDYQHRGKAGEIIEAANRADILVIEGLEKPIALAYHIKDTLYQLAAVRHKKDRKYTLSTWNYTHEWYIPEYKELFTHFSV